MPTGTTSEIIRHRFTAPDFARARMAEHELTHLVGVLAWPGTE